MASDQWAWLLVFRRRRRAWRRCFFDADGAVTRDGVQALADLKRFCGVGLPVLRLDAAGRTDELATAEAAGRLAVWNHVQKHLHLDEAFVTKLKERGDDE